MRVVGGMWRGRELKTPSGKDTRPTTDRNREAIASMVASAFSLDLGAVSVVDVFAGSGALGIEMLSRGAQRATFIDSSRSALSCIKANLKAVGSSQPVLAGDAFKLTTRQLPGSPFSLVLLDPPYAVSADDVSRLVLTLWETGQLADNAIILYERATGEPALNLCAQGLAAQSLKSKRYGSTSVDLLRINTVQDDAPKGNA